MLSFLLKLLGVRIESANRIADWSLAFRSGINPGWILLVAVVLGGVVFWMYRQAGDHLSAWRKYTLAGLRALFLVLILVLLLRPVLAFSVEGSVRQSLVMMFDSSGSMKLQDPRTSDADLKRAAIAEGKLDAAKGLDQPLDQKLAGELSHVQRIDLLKDALKDPKLKLIEQLAHQYDLRPYTFGSDLAELPTIRLAAPDEAQQKSYHLWAWTLLIASVLAVGVVWLYIWQTSRIDAREKKKLNWYRWGLAGRWWCWR